MNPESKPAAILFGTGGSELAADEGRKGQGLGFSWLRV